MAVVTGDSPVPGLWPVDLIDHIELPPFPDALALFKLRVESASISGS